MAAIIAENRQEFQILTRSLNHLSPGFELDNNRQRVDSLHVRLEWAMKGRLEYLKSRTEILKERLKSVSPLGTLARGYAIVRQQSGEVVRQVGDISAGDKLQVMVADGEFEVKVE
jgi:exodeoxyribonuclease VII large subunit